MANLHDPDERQKSELLNYICILSERKGGKYSYYCMTKLSKIIYAALQYMV